VNSPGLERRHQSRSRRYCSSRPHCSSDHARELDWRAARDQHGVDRYYDPVTGQFLTVDPLVSQTLQPYVYVGDDSVNEADPAGLVGSHLYRNGTAWESADELEVASEAAQAQAFPHGVSAFDRRPSGTDFSTAATDAVRAVFPVKKTGRNPNHYTIVLPHPVTHENAVTFNDLFGRSQPSGGGSQPVENCHETPTPPGQVTLATCTIDPLPPILSVGAVVCVSYPMTFPTYSTPVEDA
jgi:hypothetical protein